jgi:hypothetical protein
MTFDPRLLLCVFLQVIGCAAAVPRVRFQNAPVVWEVDDRRDVPVKPRERIYYNDAYDVQHTYVQQLTDPMALKAPARAASVNAIDEVPDSTWFTNRIGRRDVTVDEIRMGPNADADPEPHKPWTILRTKTGGAMPGFLIADARGVKYLLKFEEPAFPEMESAADVIVQRLFWAAGWHVPADTVVHLRAEDLQLAPDAKLVDAYGRKRPMTEAEVKTVLARLPRDGAGRIRGLTSRFLPGEPLGGYPDRGVRPDDPNDVVPHEERRELRGQYVFFAWVGHTDVKENNWLDMWREDPVDPSHHYVEHHVLDFGKALGVMGATAHDPGDAYGYNFDPRNAALSAVTFGLWSRPGEDAWGPDLPGVGRFEAKHFHPSKFRPRRRFRPFDRFDRHDALWATKILMRFTPAQIRAAVEQGELSDPRAVEYLTTTLVARQRRTGEHWLSRVNPLDDARVSEPSPGRLRVCMVDLLLAHGLSDARTRTRYVAAVYGDDGLGLAAARGIRARADGRVCIDDVPVGPGAEGYTMVSVQTRRGRKHHPPVWVHVARDPVTGRARVIGLWRE